MAKSNYLEDMILNTLFRNGTFTKPSNVYISLHSANPTDAGTGTELSGGGYARVAVSNTVTTNFNAPADNAGAQRITNAVEFTFPESTGAQGTATHFGIWTASSGGNLLYHGALGTSRAIDSAGITIRIPAGSLAISES